MTKIINNAKFFIIYFQLSLHFDVWSIRKLEFRYCLEFRNSNFGFLKTVHFTLFNQRMPFS